MIHQPEKSFLTASAKTIFDNAAFGEHCHPVMAIDGSVVPNDVYCSAVANDPWLEVDLGTIYGVVKVSYFVKP